MLSLRNRAVLVARSLLPSPDLPSTSTTMDPAHGNPDGLAEVPLQDNLMDRFAAMERLLADLNLRLPPNQPQAEAAIVFPHVPVASPEGIIIRNRRYKTVLAVSTYRLRDQTAALRPDQMTTLSSTAALIRPRLEGSFFSGTPSLGVLPFLAQVVRVADQTQISEATLLWIFEDFLRSPVKESSRIQAHCSWPSAVHWLLSSYAPESALDSALRKLQAINQGSTESVRSFGLRLQSEASYLGALVPLPEVKSLFSQGLRDPVSAHFAATQPAAELLDTVPLSVLVGRAELLERGTMSLAQRPVTVGTRAQDSRLALALPSHSSDAETLDEELEILALDSGFQRDHTQRGLTCYFCFHSGHAWIDCTYLRHLSAGEKEGIAYRRRAYFEKRRSPLKSKWEKPGWDTAHGMVRPQNSWKDEPPRPIEEFPAAENGPTSPRK